MSTRFLAVLAALLMALVGSLFLAPSASAAEGDPPPSVTWDGDADGTMVTYDSDSRIGGCSSGSGGCIFNASTTRSLVVCEDWSGTTADPGCKSGSRLATIPPRRYSPFSDTDGFRVSSGDQGQIVNCTVINGVPASCTYNGPREVKVQDLKVWQVRIIN